MISLTHSSLEGDVINSIKLVAETKKIVVHSRDNSVRLVNPYGRNGKLQVEIDYQGMLCSQTNLKSGISPDGQYLISGSEDGSPKLFHLLTGFPIDRSICHETKFNDFVSDVDWNNNFNMIAVAGFSQEYSVMLFVYEKKEDELEHDLLKMNLMFQGMQDLNENIHIDNPLQTREEEHDKLIR